MNYGPFARFRILLVAFTCCNSQSETLILGNEPIRLREVIDNACALCHDLGHALKKQPFSLALILW